jgi:hypothetical protein
MDANRHSQFLTQRRGLGRELLQCGPTEQSSDSDLRGGSPTAAETIRLANRALTSSGALPCPMEPFSVVSCPGERRLRSGCRPLGTELSRIGLEFPSTPRLARERHSDSGPSTLAPVPLLLSNRAMRVLTPRRSCTSPSRQELASSLVHNVGPSSPRREQPWRTGRCGVARIRSVSRRP